MFAIPTSFIFAKIFVVVLLPGWPKKKELSQETDDCHVPQTKATANDSLLNATTVSPKVTTLGSESPADRSFDRSPPPANTPINNDKNSIVRLLYRRSPQNHSGTRPQKLVPSESEEPAQKKELVQRK